MTKKKTYKIVAILLSVICLQFSLFQPVQAAPGAEVYKELNFVFCHGMGGNPCIFQSLEDQIYDLLPYFEDRYHELHPGINIRVNMMARCYAGYDDIDTWANSIVDSINTRFEGKEDIILVGHSMGGKTALYAVAHNTGNITDKVSAVITINSPVKNLNQYYVPGGGPMPDYCRTALLGSDAGVCESLAYYDSSADGLKISQEKHWLAFVSAEESPLSSEFNKGGVDVWPRNMDDGIVPLSAQFAEGADVVYYGQYAHSQAGEEEELSYIISNYILLYVFGYPIQFSVEARTGILDHEADWLLGTDYWSDIVGGIQTANGTITHKNESFYKWETYEDIIGEANTEDVRSYSNVHLASLPLVSNINSASWINTEDTTDCRIAVNSLAAPFTDVEIEWSIYTAGILPEETPRSFYDVEITKGTPLASIVDIKWWKDDPLNPVVWIRSKAQSPFRWFEAKWTTYVQETRTVNIIDSIPSQLIN